MTNEEIKQALKLLLKVWEKGDKEAAEALLAAKKQQRDSGGHRPQDLDRSPGTFWWLAG